MYNKSKSKWDRPTKLKKKKDKKEEDSLMVEDIKIVYDQTAKGDNGRSKDTDTFNGKSPHPRKIKNRYYEDA